MRDLPPPQRSGALALDLACGQGRHCTVLAHLGYLAVAMDISTNALRHARDRFEGTMPGAPAGRLVALCADGDHWPFAADSFALVIQVDFLERRLFPAICESLQRGGLLLVDTFLNQGRPNAHGPSRPEFLLDPDELPSTLKGMQTLRYRETRGETGRALYLGRKQ